jgi:hypothetical protein
LVILFRSIGQLGRLARSGNACITLIESYQCSRPLHKQLVVLFCLVGGHCIEQIERILVLGGCIEGSSGSGPQFGAFRGQLKPKAISVLCRCGIKLCIVNPA